MKSAFVAIAYLLFSTFTFSQQKNQNLNSMIATEYAFIAAAAELGTRDAFLKFVADDGIIFRPNPVNGKTFLSSAPKRPGLLSWYPVHAEVSMAGDMGFTTGQAEFRRNKDSAAIWFGNFCTVWQKQASGEWKFAIDIGNHNAKPPVVETPLQYQQVTSAEHQLFKGMSHNKADELLELDKKLNLISGEMGNVEMYKKFMNEESRILRDGLFPVVGLKQINDYCTTQSSNMKFKPLGGKLSSSGDFGFTYGEAGIISKDSKPAERFNYMHIYKKEKKHWVIAVEVLSKLD